MKAYVFPGQGAQFTGMGKDLYDSSDAAKQLFEQANEILGFSITDVMFEGTPEQLKETKVTQPAVFLHSVVAAKIAADFNPDMVAGHSLGELSALTASGVLSFQDGLELVAKRAQAMQRACEINPSTMAAVLGLADDLVENICGEIEEVVVAANYNCPGQVVISGSNKGIEVACEKMLEAGAKRAMALQVGGAFHSPLMEPAREDLSVAIESTTFNEGICPIYQNYTAKATMDTAEIKSNLIAQLTAPVRWTQTMHAMIDAGAAELIECGPGKVLQGLIKKVDRKFPIASIS